MGFKKLAAKWILLKTCVNLKIVNYCALLVETAYGTAAMENGMVAPQEWNIELPCDPAVPLLGMCSKEWKAGTQACICTSTVIAALFTVVREWKQLKHPLMGELIIYHNDIPCGSDSTMVWI